MLIFQRTRRFERAIRTIVLNNRSVRSKITLALRRLKRNPFNPRLDTKKVFLKKNKLRWASLITDEMWIIWDFSDAKKTKIKLIAIGSDKEPLKVYRAYKRPEKM